MNLIITLLQFKNDVIEKKISVYGAQSAFFLLLSVIPFIMALLNIFQFISPQALQTLFQLLPHIASAELSSALVYIINELQLTSNGALISVSLIGAIWSSSKGVYAIERGLNEIYGNHKKHNFIRARIISFLYMILLIAVLLFTMLVLMFGSSIQQLIGRWIPPLYRIIQLILQFRLLAAVPILVLFFMSLYTFYPGRDLRFRDQFPGAAFTAAAWIMFSFAYEFYIQNVTNYSQIYGSLGAILLLLLWIYFCICIVLFGAELNDFLQHRQDTNPLF
ncbi:MAG: YihY/virulence factor BrkB family protein [Lachnospiraceae bacterium]|nr:YihY/virulence factor BrkB family protein [Lachnospiraceae bacterium]